MNRFEPAEKLLQAEICIQHPILLDTHYNGSVIKQKRDTWDTIVLQFNSSNAGKPPYEDAQLRGLWKRLKDDAKQDSDRQRKLSQKTGGGPNAFTFRNKAVELVAGFIGASYDPLDNPCDDDVLPFQEGPSDPCPSEANTTERTAERPADVGEITETPSRSKLKKRKQEAFDDRLLKMAEEEHAKKMSILKREDETARQNEETARFNKETARMKMLLAKAELEKAGVKLD